jgi:CHAT domain-containing protein
MSDRLPRRLLCLCYAALVATVVALTCETRLRSTWQQLGFYWRIRPLLGAVREIGERQFEPQLHGFPYKPFRADRRKSSTQRNTLIAAATAIKRQRRSATDANDSHTLALAHLTLGEYEDAARIFERLLSSDSKTSESRLFADAAACFYVLATELDRREYYADAITAASCALEIDSRNAPAVFTRGLTLQRLGLYDDARSSWKRYIELDSKSGWATEARQHLKFLAVNMTSAAPAATTVIESIAQGANVDVVAVAKNRFIEFSTAFVTQGLGISWAEKVLADDPAAAEEILGNLQRAANTTSDPLLHETIEMAKQTHSKALAQAFRTYARAIADYNAIDIAAAENKLDESIDVFSQQHCPLRFAASIQKAGCRYYVNDFKGALQITIETLQILPDRYRGVRGRLFWIAGLCHAILGHPEESLQAYVIAIADLKSIGDADGVSAVESLLAEEYEYLGDREAAAQHRITALVSAYRSGSSYRISMSLSEAGAAAAKIGKSDLASLIYERMIDISRRTRHSLTTVDALLAYGQVLANRGKTDAATTAFRDAVTVADQQKHPDVRSRLRATIALRTAEAGIAGTLPLLDTAVQVFERSGDYFLLVDTLRTRARRDAGRDPFAAETDLRRGLSVITRELGNIADPATRAAYLERRQDFFDDLVPLLMKRGDVRKAFEAADEAHHALLSTYRKAAVNDFAPISPIDVPAGTFIVGFFVADDEAFSWTLANGTVTGRRITTPARDLERHITTLEEAIMARRNGDVRALLRRLDELLLEPAISRAEKPSRIIIIPDRFLFRIPFAALIHPNGSYRISDSVVGLNFSARHYIESLRRYPATVVSDVITIVAAGRGISGAAALPEVARETKALQELYARTEISSGTTPGFNFVAAIGRHQTAHVATHGFTDTRQRLRSGLSVGGRAVVSAYEIAIARFPATRLVFLNACSTNAPADERTAVGNVSAAFLAAGVPMVVGVLWDIPDASARVMAVAFHSALRNGMAPHEALRDAQLHFIESNAHNDSLVWAGYVAVGSSTINMTKGTKCLRPRPSS